MNEYDADIYLHFKLFSNNNLIFYSPSPPGQGETEKGAAARGNQARAGRPARADRPGRAVLRSGWAGTEKSQRKEEEEEDEVNGELRQQDRRREHQQQRRRRRRDPRGQGANPAEACCTDPALRRMYQSRVRADGRRPRSVTT